MIKIKANIGKSLLLSRWIKNDDLVFMYTDEHSMTQGFIICPSQGFIISPSEYTIKSFADNLYNYLQDFSFETLVYIYTNNTEEELQYFINKFIGFPNLILFMKE